MEQANNNNKDKNEDKDMMGIIAALIVGGVAGVIAKDKLVGNPELQNKVREVEKLINENVALREDKKKLSRQVEDLLGELKKVRQASQDNEDDKDDMEDDLMKARMELKKVKKQNEELARSLQEYKSACEAQEAEIKSLKDKQN